ncbi:MAG TPA: nuclease-related domain-containing protein [Nocardioidaceae bacterium]|nr:nuclease-related domain-containing protein [Nocardioidaceae bacterium]
MTKYKPYSRRELQHGFGTWVRRNTKVIALLTVGAIGLLALEIFLLVILGPAAAWSWYTLGVTHAVVVAAYLYLLQTAFLAHDRAAIFHLRGAWGEDNTRSELQRAKRKHLLWGWVDSISLQAGDIDHLVVTRHGGLVAVDSKWRNQHTSGDANDMAREARKVRLRAEGVTRTILSRERTSRHRASGDPWRVTPVVVLWGAAQDGVPENARIDGIDFVAGRRFVDWLARLDGHPVSKDAASDVLARLEDYRSGAWKSTQRADR